MQQTARANGSMRKFHVCTFSARSGIAHYASDFFDLVLARRGYEKVDLDSDWRNKLEGISANDVVHVEVGVNQHSEVELLYKLLERRHKRIDVTLHDPPFLRWPYFRSNNRILTGVFKIAQLYVGNFGIGNSDMRRIRNFFVLTEKGCKSVRQRYGINNVYHMPYVVRPSDIVAPGAFAPHLMFFGFVAENKGLHYALALHEHLLNYSPEMMFYVVGGVINDAGQRYLDEQMQRYQKNVRYLGFVGEADVAKSFAAATFAVLPFTPYRSIIPASASVINAMKMGRVVVSTNVNAVDEYVRDRQTGLLLSGNLAADVAKLREALINPQVALRIATAATDFLRSHLDPASVGRAFDCAKLETA